MSKSQTPNQVKPLFRLLSDRSAKRWGRRFVFAWLVMWTAAALLPCCEVVAAVAAHGQALHPDCDHGSSPAPESSGGHKSGICLDISAPAPAAADKLAGSASNDFAQQFLGISATPHFVLPRPTQSPPVSYSVAPPPIAVYLRNTRLLI
jgi:hypothetical protein